MSIRNFLGDEANHQDAVDVRQKIRRLMLAAHNAVETGDLEYLRAALREVDPYGDCRALGRYK